MSDRINQLEQWLLNPDIPRWKKRIVYTASMPMLLFAFAVLAFEAITEVADEMIHDFREDWRR